MSTLTPYLCCHDASKAIDFYVTGLGATELFRLAEPDGRIGHAELSIGGAIFYLSDEYPEVGCAAPAAGVGAGVTMHLLVPDVDAAVARAAEQGATVSRPPKDEFYGHRAATIVDPFHHRWMLSTEIERLSADEVIRRHRQLIAAA